MSRTRRFLPVRKDHIYTARMVQHVNPYIHTYTHKVDIYVRDINKATHI